MSPERDSLEEVRAAKARLDSAAHEYRRATVVAVTALEEAGDRKAYAKVALAAGVSRQSLREQVMRARAAAAEKTA